jgi:hypothetical protein
MTPEEFKQLMRAQLSGTGVLGTVKVNAFMLSFLLRPTCQPWTQHNNQPFLTSSFPPRANCVPNSSHT